MPSNVEIKARLADRPRTEAAVAALSDGPPATLRQRDTFFRCGRGRLKLREHDGGPCQLIAYDRPNVAGVKLSAYEIAEIGDVAATRRLLDRALGQRGVVEKTRVLYRIGQTRVHLDAVAGLGDFLELEVVLEPDQSSADGAAIALGLMRRLGLDVSDLVETAYIDLLVPDGA